MKKISILLISLFSLVLTAKAGDDIPIDFSQLPQNSQSFVKQHFPNDSIAYAKMEKEFFGSSYEVILVNGAKMEFNSDGAWKEVKCKYSVVPNAIIPVQITQYVESKFPKTVITQIEKKRNKIEIKLNNSIEIEFNDKFQVIDIDY